MPQPISSLNLFTTYGSREEYAEKTGKPCPAWDATRPPKAWEDPNARKAFVVAGVAYALYPRVFVHYDQAAKLPIWDQLGVPVDHAKTVNIPPKGDGQTNVPGADVPDVPCPMRELRDDEVIGVAFGAIPMVYTTGELEETVVGFTAADRAILLAIKAKLGA